MIKEQFLVFLISLLSSIIALTLLIVWFQIPIYQDIQVRIPAKEGSLAMKEESDSISFKGGFLKFNSIASSIKGIWPEFRGAQKDNISKEKIDLHIIEIGKQEVIRCMLWEQIGGNRYPQRLFGYASIKVR